MIGWLVLTLIACILISLCNTISAPKTLRPTRHPSSSVERILNQEIDLSGEFATCANGAQYRKDVRGFLPELMEKIYKDRTIYKKKMLAAKQEYEKKKTKTLEKEIARCNNIQMARKIQLNSAYGAIGNEYFRYYKLENAEAITLSGQVSIRWVENMLNERLNKILKLRRKIMLLLWILILFILTWALWLKGYSRGERKLLKALFRSLIRSVKWNLKSIFRVLMKRWPST